MFRGFYNLTSGMLTQGRNLDVISNNMTNISTAGYKTAQYTASTFGDVLISHTGNKEKSNATEIGKQSYMLAPSKLYTDFTQGVLEETGQPLDFAIEGDGFFSVKTDNGVAYTRSGSFSLDDEGYLCLGGQGRILGKDGEPIQLITDKISADKNGNLYNESGSWLGQIGVYTFQDNSKLTRNDQDLFVSNTQPTLSNDAVVHYKSLEGSNVDLMSQMVDMMSAERAYQSAAQVTKMYDQVMSKVTTEVGKV